jgi:hypothetical protein
MKLPLAKTVVALVAISVATSTLRAADPLASGNPYEIKNILRVTKAIAWVDNGWKDSVPCIQADLHVTRELVEEKPFARAYFFDRENKLVQTYKNPPQVSEDHKNYTTLPSVFKLHQANKVSFPISEKANQPSSRWSRVVIVFGDATNAVAEIYPKDDLSKFDFPEKNIVSKPSSQSPGQTGLKSPGQTGLK